MQGGIKCMHYYALLRWLCTVCRKTTEIRLKNSAKCNGWSPFGQNDWRSIHYSVTQVISCSLTILCHFFLSLSLFLSFEHPKIPYAHNCSPCTYFSCTVVTFCVIVIYLNFPYYSCCGCSLMFTSIPLLFYIQYYIVLIIIIIMMFWRSL